MIEPVLTVLSFGGGQDSTALLYKYVYDADFRARYAPGRFLVVMSDTNDEHPETKAHVKEVVNFCAQHGVEFVWLTADKGYHSGKWQGLREFYRRTNTCGSKAFPKTCTDNLKLVPIYKFLESWVARTFSLTKCGRKSGFYEFVRAHGKINVLLGIAKGEEGRVADDSKGKKWMRECLRRVYPLIDIGLDRQGCQDYIRNVGHTVPPPSNCMLCPFMSEIELLWLFRFYPADYQEWVVIEQNKFQANAHMGERNLGVWGRKTLPQKLADAEARYGQMTNAELQEYKMSHGHCVKSKY